MIALIVNILKKLATLCKHVFNGDKYHLFQQPTEGQGKSASSSKPVRTTRYAIATRRKIRRPEWEKPPPFAGTTA